MTGGTTGTTGAGRSTRSVAVLSAGCSSRPAEVTTARLVALGTAAAETASVRDSAGAVAPGASGAASAQVTTCPATVQVHPAEVWLAAGVRPAGAVSVSTTEVATDGPALRTRERR